MSNLTIPFTGLKKQYNNLRTEILDATDEVLRSGQLMNGNYTVEFENWLAKKNHSKYAVTCHSGTQALEILAAYYLESRGMPNPPTVIIPTMTYVATANAFMRAGWRVELVDTDRNGIMDVSSLPVDKSIQAAVVVGLYGASVERRLLPGDILIEDGAQHWLANDCHRIGNSTAISFDPMKNLSCYGNGGAVVTDDVNLFEFANEWRDNGKPAHTSLGTNSRMSEIDCAQMMVKTQYLDDWQRRREDIALYWMARLKKTKIRSLIDDTNVSTHAFHKFVVEVEQRDRVQRNLALKKIETRIHYKEPLHEMPVYAGLAGPNILSVASSLSRHCLTLPLYPELTDLEVEYVIDSLIDCA